MGRLEAELQNLNLELSNLKSFTAGLNIYMNSMIYGGPRLGSELAAEKVGLEIKIADLEEQIKELEALKEERDSEKKKYTSEYEMEKSKRMRLIVDINAVEEALEEMKERNEVLLEKSKKTKKDHEEEIERMKRRYEAQSNNEGEKLTEAKNKIGSLETEGKKARSHFNDRMREQERLRVNTENDREGVEVLLAEKERKVKDLKEK